MANRLCFGRLLSYAIILLMAPSCTYSWSSTPRQSSPSPGVSCPGTSCAQVVSSWSSWWSMIPSIPSWPLSWSSFLTHTPDNEASSRPVLDSVPEKGCQVDAGLDVTSGTAAQHRYEAYQYYYYYEYYGWYLNQDTDEIGPCIAH
eukprot:1266140-Amphidinium_carterae.1